MLAPCAAGAAWLCLAPVFYSQDEAHKALHFIWGSLLRLPSSWPMGARGRDTWTALRDTTSGDSGDEFQKPVPKHHFGAALPHIRSNLANKRNKAQSVVKKKQYFHLKSANTLEVSHLSGFFAREVWHSKRFQWFSHKISKHAWSVVKNQWLSPKISQNAWSVALFYVFSKKSVTLRAFSMILT